MTTGRDAVPFPLLVSQTGRWVSPSRYTEIATDARGGWNARAALGHRLGLRNEAVLQKVWKAVEAAVRQRETTAVLAPGTTGAPPTLLLVRPAREPGFAIITRQRVDTPAPTPPARILTELFGLTPVEATVAVCLLRGDELSTIAAARGTSLETVRGHVKNVLRKTGLSSQKQLTAMLSRIAMLASEAVVPEAP